MTREFGIRLLAPTAFGVALVLVTTRGSIRYTTDSICYWSAAHAIAEGNGLRSGVLFDERLARLGNGEDLSGQHLWPRVAAEPGEAEGRPRDYHPFTAWPPGFPALVAVGIAAGLPADGVGLAIELVSLAVFVVGIGQLARRLGGESFALGVAGIAAVSPFVQSSAPYFLSDVPFVASAVWALFFLVRWLEAPDARMRDLAFANLLGLFATLVRYLGVLVFVAEMLLVAPSLWRRARARNFRRRSLGPALAPFTCLLVLVPLIVRNFSLTGHLGGVERLPSDKGLLANVRDLAESTVRGLSPVVRDAFPGPFDLLISGAAFAALVVAAFLLARRGPRDPLAPRSVTARVLATFAAVYTLAVLYLRTRVLADEISPRLLMPALACALPLGAHIVSARLPVPARGWIAGALILLLTAAVVAESRSELEKAESDRNRRLEIRHRVDETAGKAVAPFEVFSDQAIDVHLALERPVHWMPAPRSLVALREGMAPRSMIFVVRHESPFFRCREHQDAYVTLLASHADEVVLGDRFDLYRLEPASKRPILQAEAEHADLIDPHCSP